MKELKRQAREIISDIVEKNCVTCTKRQELGFNYFDFTAKYCSIQCPTGRDLKKLGDLLDTKTRNVPKESELEMAVIEKMEPTKENYEKLLKEGKKNHEIARIFGMSEPNFYYRKKKWKDEPKVKPTKPKPAAKNKSIGEHMEVFFEKQEPVEMPVIQPDYSRDIEKYELEIEGLRESNRLLSEKLKELDGKVSFNRETYEDLAKAQETIKDLRLMVRVANEETESIQTKYDALKTYAKAIM